MTSRFDDPRRSPGFLLWRVTLQWQRAVRAALEPVGLTHTQFVVLAAVWWLEQEAAEPPSQRRVAELVGIDPMTASQVLRALEGRGHLSRVDGRADARQKLIALSREGVRVAEQAVTLVEEADGVFFATADERVLVEQLRSVTASR